MMTEIKKEIHSKRPNIFDYNKQELLELFETINIPTEEAEKAILDCPELKDANLSQIKATILSLQTDFLLTQEDIKHILKREPQNLLVSADEYRRMADFLTQKIGLTRKNFSNLFTRNNMQNNYTDEFLDDYINKIQEVCLATYIS